MNTPPIGPEYSVRLYRNAPETRWFRRVILRHRTRLILVFAGLPTAFQWDRSLNGGNSLSITAEDASSFMTRRMAHR